MLCDVDSFKAYNDTYGHFAGDEVLERVAKIISENLRAGDTAYRYGGEEFLIILPEQDLKSASVVAERLRRGVGDGPRYAVMGDRASRGLRWAHAAEPQHVGVGRRARAHYGGAPEAGGGGLVRGDQGPAHRYGLERS
jgi:PleD family two-component response regulator